MIEFHGLVRDWALSGQREPAENLLFRIKPIIERNSLPKVPFGIELIGAFFDQDVQIFVGRLR
jgi:hypothetical protein